MVRSDDRGFGGSKRSFARFPVGSLSAEYLGMAALLRCDVMVYKAPSGNEGYDLVCIHPDPRHSGRQVRIQVKSRMASDCDRGLPLKLEALDAFDFLVVVFLNVGYYLGKARTHECRDGTRPPELYTLTPSFLRERHDARSSWQKVRLGGVDLEPFRDDRGLEAIAMELGVSYPHKPVRPRAERTMGQEPRTAR